jgi:glutamate 5-kinase
MNSLRKELRDKKRIVIKIGTSTITHEETGSLNLMKLEKLVRVVCDIRNKNKDVIIVSSGAISVGRKALGLLGKKLSKPQKQACAAVGQARLMMVYQKLFAEYNHIPAQVLMTKYTMINDISRENAKNTFEELLDMNVIPIVNENDTVSTSEIELPINDSSTSFAFGDNDSLSAIVSALVGADLLILLSDIDGLYTKDPNKDENAKFIDIVDKWDDKIEAMASGSASSCGTGGMITKFHAAKIATASGADMIIANGKRISIINSILEGKDVGTLFVNHKDEEFDLLEYIENIC